jgi:hypothetical protein
MKHGLRAADSNEQEKKDDGGQTSFIVALVILTAAMLGLCRLLYTYMENMARKMRIVNKAVTSLQWKTKQNNRHPIAVLSSTLL